MRKTRLAGFKVISMVIFVLASLPFSLKAATFLGPTPYLSFTNSPFFEQSFHYFYLETFEDDLLNTPGVTANGGVVAQPGTGTDSVDADDGVIDGYGRKGHSYYSQFALTNFTFTFSTNVLGRLPTHAGVVYTDSVTGFLVSFEAFDQDSNSLGIIGPFTLGITNQNTGETAEDRFFGVINSNGVSAIKISCNDRDWEIDHLQYGWALDSAPTITSLPTNFTVNVGASITLNAAVTGTIPMAYQWQLNGNDLAGGTNRQWTVASATTNDAGTYSLVITNVYGAATGVVASVAVTVPVSTPVPDGLVSWWKAEGNGEDSAGTNHAVVTGVEYTPGKVGTAFDMSGPGDLITAPANSNLNLLSLTMEGWFYPRNLKTAQPLLDSWQSLSYGNNSYGINLWLNMGSNADEFNPVPGGLLGNLVTPAGTWHLIASPAGAVTSNQWQHIAMTYDYTSGVSRIYVNSAKVAEVSLGQFVPCTTLPISIGCRGPTRGFSGKVDELSLFNRALSSNEIASIFNAGSAGKSIPEVAPSVVSQVTNMTVGLGSDVSIQPVISGSSPISFQWLINGTNVEGANSEQFRITAANLADAGTYSIVLSNAYGMATGLVANVTVMALPPSITSQPANQIVLAGNNATMHVGASGSPSLLYQWRLNGTDVGEATNATLVLSNVIASQAGNYSVVVSNAYGWVTSSNATLTVIEGVAVGVFDNPAYVDSTGGSSAESDTVQASLAGLAYVTVQPFTNFITAVGANEVLLIPELEKADLVTNLTVAERTALNRFVNNGGTLIIHGSDSSPARCQNLLNQVFGFSLQVVKISDPLLFSRTDAAYGTTFADDPATISSMNGSDAILTSSLPIGSHSIYERAGQSVVAEINCGGGKIIFLGWDWFNAAPVGAQNGGWLTILASAVMERTPVGPTPPNIYASPASQTALMGSAAIFNVGVFGSAPLSYQWLFNGALVPDATNATLLLSDVRPNQAGDYVVVITNSLGSATSGVATLLVQFPPAKVMVGSATAPAGAPVTVPILMVANGNENAMSFSLNYNASALTFVGVEAGTNLVGATVIPNSSLADSGRLGILMSLPASEMFDAGTQEVVRVTFRTASTTSLVTNFYNLTFGTQPLAQFLSDSKSSALAGSFTNSGTIAVIPCEYEADVAPVGAPDRRILANDWVQVGRYVGGLDDITNALDFQRVDCSPRSTSGDGIISLADWVQAGRFAAGLDALQAAGGPTASEPSLTRKALLPRNINPVSCTVSVAEVSLQLGLTNRVAILLTAQGNENALSFSLNYDPAKLVYANGVLAPAASGSQLIINAKQAATGKVGVMVALASGGTFAAGAQQVVFLDFFVPASARGSVGVTFGETPLRCEVLDAQIGSLTPDWQGKTLAIASPTLKHPQVTTGVSGNSLTFTWPAAFGNEVLEWSDSITATNWVPVPLTPTQVGADNQVVAPATEGQKFFRLRLL